MAKRRRRCSWHSPTGNSSSPKPPRVDWGPVVDGLDIPDQPRTLYEIGAFSHVPVIIGATRDEGWIYVDRSFPGGLIAAQYDEAVRKSSAIPTRRPSWRVPGR